MARTRVTRSFIFATRTHTCVDWHVHDRFCGCACKYTLLHAFDGLLRRQICRKSDGTFVVTVQGVRYENVFRDVRYYSSFY